MQESENNTALAFSPACERNRDAILTVLQSAIGTSKRVLEVGSGSGQHVVHFANAMPTSRWQPTDQQAYLPALQARLRAEAPENVAAAIELDVRDVRWPGPVDAVFSANTLHYMSLGCVEAFFAGIGQVLAADGVLVVYGPFRYAQEHTSTSNERFDEWLRQSDPVRGVRDFEWVVELAGAQQLQLVDDIMMPANNRTLVWRRQTLT
jgi:cyclopropane fatty-acyl-phospholipid synthase-like methyltransferase